MSITTYLNKKKFLKKAAVLVLNSAIKWYRIFFCSKRKGGAAVILSLHKLGDSVFTLHTIKILQKFYDSKIYLVCFPETKPIFENIFSDIELITLEHQQFYFTDRIASSSARKTIKNLNPGTIIDLTGVITSASLIFNSKAGDIYGINEEYYRAVYDLFIPIKNDVHLAEIYLEVVRKKFGWDGKLVNKFPASYDVKDKILIHPFAGWEAKEWNIDKFIELAVYLSERFECAVISPKNKLKAKYIEMLSGKCVNYIETENVEDLMFRFKDCGLLIANDSGPVHIASMMGKPTFTIYGPTNPSFHIPPGEIHTYILKQIFCTPTADKKYCYTNGGRDGCYSYQCMNGLTFEEVKESVDKFISKIGLEEKKTGKEELF